MTELGLGDIVKVLTKTRLSGMNWVGIVTDIELADGIYDTEYEIHNLDRQTVSNVLIEGLELVEAAPKERQTHEAAWDYVMTFRHLKRWRWQVERDTNYGE